MDDNNLKIMGSGHISSGEYNEIKILGSATSDGKIKASNINVNGSVIFEEDVTIKNLKVNGEVKFDSNFICSEIKVNGNLNVLDSIKAENIKVNGYLIVNGDIECDYLELNGSIKCKGFINAEKIIFSLKRKSFCSEIGTASVDIHKIHDRSIFNYLSPSNSILFECDTIESDYISLQNCKICDIRAKNIDLVNHCIIDTAEYSDTLNISKNSTVKKINKID